MSLLGAERVEKLSTCQKLHYVSNGFRVLAGENDFLSEGVYTGSSNKSLEEKTATLSNCIRI